MSALAEYSDPNDFRKALLQKLARWDSLGHRITPSGAVQIGHVPHVAPLAWFHELYPPISEADRASLAKSIPGYQRSQLGFVHAAFNGLNLFSSNFFLFGKRKNFDRTSGDAFPWDLQSTYSSNKRRLPPDSLIVGGSHALPHGIYFVEKSDGSVDALDRRLGFNCLFSWPSVLACLFSEINRLEEMFDGTGHLDPVAHLEKFCLR